MSWRPSAPGEKGGELFSSSTAEDMERWKRLSGGQNFHSQQIKTCFIHVKQQLIFREADVMITMWVAALVSWEEPCLLKFEGMGVGRVRNQKVWAE